MMFLFTAMFILVYARIISTQQWIDPHDMNVKDSHFIQSINSEHVSPERCDCPTSINFSISHYKRLINLLLDVVAVDAKDTFNYKGGLLINIPLENYNFLKDFVRDSSTIKEDSATLRKVDQILSKILIKPTQEYLSDALISWMDHIYFTFYNRTSGVLLACVFVLFISYKLLRANLTIWSVIKYLIFLGWVTDFAFTWINLLHDAEINKMADSLKYESLPPYCDPNKMTNWQYLTHSLRYFFGSMDDCRNYHHAIYKDHFWSIAPVTVLSHQLGVVILTPASHIGQALGHFTSGLLGSLPWGVNILLLPLLLIFSAVIFCISFSFITGTSFGFNFLHIFQLEFGNEQRRAVGDVLSGRNLTALLNIAHRSMVEDVKLTDCVENLVPAESSSCSNQYEEPLMIKDETSTFSICKRECEKLNQRKEGETSKETHESSQSCTTESCIKCLKKQNSLKKNQHECEDISNIKTTECKDDFKNKALKETIHDGDGDKF